MRLRPMSRPLALVAVLAAVGPLAACSGDDTAAADPQSTPAASDSASASASSGAGECAYPAGEPASKQVDAPPATPAVSGTVKATMSTNIGDFQLTLDADRTPCTVNNFVSLAEQGYFDKTPCHRLVTEGIYVLQCGDPTGTGTGGPGYTIPDELKGDEDYSAGALAMAKTQFPDSGGSQFFIVYADSTGLPKDYTVFGKVDAAAVKAIAQVAKAGTKGGQTPTDGAPAKPVDITKVTVDGR
ncbi:peptidylprolyl isomerase [Nocardioides sp. TRM66260-LWL]|uniref:peptidylprolyl isomerase n=1 Tax=Nocardioides sp. TRM66260-LWL TaxID=2874478 RepID=UPI001CC36331|nr:peptidylprolyl isomerase [Nocardioides sp. TRM66260-LWL]MBZ5734029.1 peptidylprolyl isomerase [Nocardioides sp. TRM66260-LWL]